jgi:hypothetical protein
MKKAEKIRLFLFFNLAFFRRAPNLPLRGKAVCVWVGNSKNHLVFIGIP